MRGLPVLGVHDEDHDLLHEPETSDVVRQVSSQIVEINDLVATEDVIKWQPREIVDSNRESASPHFP